MTELRLLREDQAKSEIYRLSFPVWGIMSVVALGLLYLLFFYLPKFGVNGGEVPSVGSFTSLYLFVCVLLYPLALNHAYKQWIFRDASFCFSGSIP